MSLLGKLHDGKGFEWYHLVAVGVIVWFVAFNQGSAKGTLDTQRCDQLDIILDNKEFQPSMITIHPCDSIRFTDKDYSNYEVQDEKNSTFFKISTGESVIMPFNKQGSYLYHTDRYPDIMSIRVIVQ
jgi:plastocyanin